MSETVHGIAVYLMILNIVLPGFVYAFVNFSDTAPPETGLIDQESLITSGLYLEGTETHNLTYGNYAEFTNSSTIWRLKWFKPTVSQANWYFYKEAIDYGDWIFQEQLPVVIAGELHTVVQSSHIGNQTIIGAWEGGPGLDTNWTRVSLKSLGLEAFITCEGHSHNITDAVLVHGEVNVTAGKPVDFEDLDASNFIQWYWGLLTGSQSYGLPAFVQWLFQIQAVLLIFSAVIIGRELLPL